MRLLIVSLLASVLVILASLSSAQTASASATFTIVNLDGPGEGFNDPTATTPVGGNTGTTIGQQRIIAFQYAADIWAELINSPVVIRVGAKFDPLSCTANSATLGSAGPNTVHRDFAAASVPNTWYTQAQANSLFGGDLNPAQNDITATFSSTIGSPGCLENSGWHYGLDSNPPAGKIDFVTVLLHELGHGVGFLSLVSLSTGQKFGGFDDAYMRHLEDHTTGKSFPLMTDAERLASSVNSGNLHWTGPNVVAGSGGLTSGVHPSGHVQMYAPNPAQSGSSVSHWNTALFPNELMEPAYTGARHDAGLTLELFADLGWSVVEVPALSTVTITATDNTATEQGPTTGTFTVSRTGSTVSTLTVNYSVGGTATPGGDYQALSGSVEIPLGQSSATVIVTPIDDAVVGEGDETVIVTLAADVAYDVGAQNSAAVTIIDNDLVVPDTIIDSTPALATNSTGASFTFTSTVPGSSFECSLNGAAFSACANPKDFARLRAGNHNFRVRATASGLTDPTPASFDWTVDTKAPNTTISSAPAKITNNPQATFEFSSTEPGGTFQCSVDAGSFVPCASPITTDALSDGKHTFQVKAVDAVGNADMTAAKAKPWTVDTTPPETTITTTPANPTTSTSASFKFKSSEIRSTFQCDLDGAGFTSCKSGQKYTGLLPGPHVFQVQATDAAGNIDPTPAVFNWTIQ